MDRGTGTVDPEILDLRNRVGAEREIDSVFCLSYDSPPLGLSTENDEQQTANLVPSSTLFMSSQTKLSCSLR